MKAAGVALLGLALAGAAFAQHEGLAPGQLSAPDVPPGPARIEGVVLRSESGAAVAGAEVAL